MDVSGFLMLPLHVDEADEFSGADHAAAVIGTLHFTPSGAVDGDY